QMVGQSDLVEQQLKAGLQADSVELELDGIVRVDILPAQRCNVEDDRHAQRLLQVEANLRERGGAIEWEVEWPQQDILNRRRPGTRWLAAHGGGAGLLISDGASLHVGRHPALRLAGIARSDGPAILGMQPDPARGDEADQDTTQQEHPWIKP